jgi:hypothetical protein
MDQHLKGKKGWDTASYRIGSGAPARAKVILTIDFFSSVPGELISEPRIVAAEVTPLLRPFVGLLRTWRGLPDD